MHRYSFEAGIAIRLDDSNKNVPALPRRVLTNLEDIVKETKRLQKDPDLFPSKPTADYFWSVMKDYLQAFVKLQKTVQNYIWDHHAPELEEVNKDTITIKPSQWDAPRGTTSQRKPFKFCPECTAVFEISVRDYSLTKKMDHIHINPLDFGKNAFFKEPTTHDRTLKDGRVSFTAENGKRYSLPGLSPNIQTHLFRMRMKDRCLLCKEVHRRLKCDDSEIFVHHKLQSGASRTRKPWQKWFRNLNRSSAKNENRDRSCSRRRDLIKQRVPPGGSMILRRARFMYSSIRRRYQQVN